MLDLMTLEDTLQMMNDDPPCRIPHCSLITAVSGQYKERSINSRERLSVCNSLMAICCHANFNVTLMCVWGLIRTPTSCQSSSLRCLWAKKNENQGQYIFAGDAPSLTFQGAHGHQSLR